MNKKSRSIIIRRRRRHQISTCSDWLVTHQCRINQKRLILGFNNVINCRGYTVWESWSYCPSLMLVLSRRLMFRFFRVWTSRLNRRRRRDHLRNPQGTGLALVGFGAQTIVFRGPRAKAELRKYPQLVRSSVFSLIAHRSFYSFLGEKFRQAGLALQPFRPL